MDLTLLLTIISIAVAIIIGLWQIHLTQKQISEEKKKSASVDIKPNSKVKDAISETQSSSSKEGTVLWVDDEIWIHYPVIELLEKDGFFFQTATNLHEAKNILSTGQRFDLILTDLILPRGDVNLDKDGLAKYIGLEIPKLAREVNSNVPILCVTVVNNKQVINELEKMGVEYFAKPYLPSRLVEKIKFLLLEPSSPDKTRLILTEIKRRRLELTSDSADIRKHSIWALGEIGHHDTTVIVLLKEIVKTDNDQGVQEAAKEAVRKIQRRLRQHNSK